MFRITSRDRITISISGNLRANEVIKKLFLKANLKSNRLGKTVDLDDIMNNQHMTIILDWLGFSIIPG